MKGFHFALYIFLMLRSLMISGTRRYHSRQEVPRYLRVNSALHLISPFRQRLASAHQPFHSVIATSHLNFPLPFRSHEYTSQPADSPLMRLFSRHRAQLETVSLQKTRSQSRTLDLEPSTKLVLMFRCEVPTRAPSRGSDAKSPIHNGLHRPGGAGGGRV